MGSTDSYGHAMKRDGRPTTPAAEFRSPDAEQMVRRLIVHLPQEQLNPAHSHAVRLNALPIGMDLWADYYLRPNGEVVVVGDDFDHPDRDTIYTDRVTLLFVLSWGTETYSELQQFLPERAPGAADCLFCQRPGANADQRRTCLDCGGVGWFPPTFASD